MLPDPKPANKHLKEIGARGFPLRLISSLGVRGGGLARFQNCSVGGGVQPKYFKNSQKVQTQNPRHWALENRLGAVQHAILHGISPRFFLVSQFIRKINTKPQIYKKLNRYKSNITHKIYKTSENLHLRST